MLHPKIQRDLELVRHGLKIIQLKQDITVPTEDGKHIAMGENSHEFLQQFESLAAGDGAAYMEFEHLLTEVADVLRSA